MLAKLREELEPLRATKKIKIPTLKEDMIILKAAGCESCDSSGYKNRIGVFEIFLVDDDMEKFILKEESAAAIKEFAAKKGMVTMKQDGFLKAIQGLTTIEEVEKIIGG